MALGFIFWQNRLRLGFAHFQFDSVNSQLVASMVIPSFAKVLLKRGAGVAEIQVQRLVPTLMQIVSATIEVFARLDLSIHSFPQYSGAVAATKGGSEASDIVGGGSGFSRRFTLFQAPLF